MVEKKVEFKEDKSGLTVKIYGARASYAYLDTPDAKGTYRSQFIIPKTAKGAETFREAYKAFGVAKFGGSAWKSAAFKDGDRLIEEKRDQGGDVEGLAHYAGSYVLSGFTFADKKTGKKPDIRGNCYSGCTLAAILRVCPYDYTDETTKAKTVGLHAYINGVVFQEDGERLGGERINADALGLADPDPLKAVEKKEEYTDDIPF
jgi:hypothetical protein